MVCSSVVQALAFDLHRVPNANYVHVTTAARAHLLELVGTRIVRVPTTVGDVVAVGARKFEFHSSASVLLTEHRLPRRDEEPVPLEALGHYDVPNTLAHHPVDLEIERVVRVAVERVALRYAAQVE